MHQWGDEGVDWQGIGDAAEWIGSRLLWMRIPVSQTKEKYGTVRVYCDFQWYSLHSIFYPRYHYIRWKDKSIMRWLEYNTQVGRMVQFASRLMVPAWEWWYRHTYAAALKKWPHLAGEILMGADHMSLLHGLDDRLRYEQDNGGCMCYSWKGNDNE